MSTKKKRQTDRQTDRGTQGCGASSEPGREERGEGEDKANEWMTTRGSEASRVSVAPVGGGGGGRGGAGGRMSSEHLAEGSRDACGDWKGGEGTDD